MHRQWLNDPLQATQIRLLPWLVASWLVVVLCDGLYVTTSSYVQKNWRGEFFSATAQNHQPQWRGLD
jgi:hypothetical protein